MSRPELGTKRTDPETGRKFYDLGKDPIVSPYTGTSYPLSFFEAPASVSSRYGPAQNSRPVHREEDQDENAEERDEEDTDTVSLSDVAEDEADDSKPETVDEDDDEKEEKDADDTFLALDEDDDSEDVEDLIGERDEDEN